MHHGPIAQAHAGAVTLGIIFHALLKLMMVFTDIGLQVKTKTKIYTYPVTRCTLSDEGRGTSEIILVIASCRDDFHR
jgi:hypothetical protein